MAKKKTGITAKKPHSFWSKPLKAEYVALFKALSKAAVHGLTGKASEIIADATDAATALGLTTEPGEMAFTLVQKATTQAIHSLLSEGTPLDLVDNEAAAESLSDRMDFSSVAGEIAIGRDFFSKPAQLELVPITASLLEQWLILQKIDSSVAKALARRFPDYFVHALNALWRKHAKSFAPLREALETPFTEASEREDAWREYAALLQRRSHEGVFGEPFGLLDVYVPLFAWCLDKRTRTCATDSSQIDDAGGKGHRKEERHVFELEKELTDWVEGRQQTSLDLRIVSGGPGSGKSTALRILAAKWATQGHKVVFVPLHLLPEPTGDVVADVWTYLKELGFFSQNPLDSRFAENVVLIFDGLDELSSRGRIAAEVARTFMRAIDGAAKRRNEASKYLRILVSGRELSVQETEAEFSLPRQIINLLPYAVADRDRKNNPLISWIDPGNLLKKDLRDKWWNQYGSLRGESWEGLPAELKRPDLEEVTAQPLLNYLVALTKVRGQIDLSKELNINAIYADLVIAVHERGYEKHGKHATIRHMKLADFVRVLEEVALAAWHGSDGRTTTVREIQEHCQTSGVGKLLESFQDGAKAGVTRLLAAFFFRRQGHDAAGDDTFEFTHKSFGEYLTACRLTRGIERIGKETQDREDSPDQGWDEQQALAHWLKLTGPSPVSTYLHHLWINEVSSKSRDVLNRWQNALVRLFNHVLRYGSPLETVHGLSFQQCLSQSRNSEESLLAALNACARVTEIISVINHPSSTTFFRWFKRIQGQRESGSNPLVAMCISWLDLSKTTCHIADLYAGNLENSDLSEVRAQLACFWNARLEYANLRGANLEGAHLNGAILNGAILNGANLNGAHLNGAILNGAILEGANLEGAILEGAILEGADLRRADLRRADLRRADLRRANLEGAILEGAILKGAILKGAILKGTRHPVSQQG